MEAGGVASEKTDAQYASKDDYFHLKSNDYEKQCDFLTDVSLFDPSKQGIWGLNKCYNNFSTDKSPIRQSKSDHKTTTTDDFGQDRNNNGISKVVSYKRGPWTKAEDAILRKVVEELGATDWVKIETQSGLDRTSKSCRLRWKNHLQPNLKKGSFSFNEERDVVKMHYQYGNKWSLMAKRLPGRSDNEIKNWWHSRIKKCQKRGLPLYPPEWCLEEDQTSNCMKSNDEKMETPEPWDEDHKTRNCSYYNPATSTNETLIIGASPTIKSPKTEFCFPQDNAHTTLCHENSSVTESTRASHPNLFPSFQYFLSPRPKASQSSSSTFSTTHYQQECNNLGNFDNAPMFETFQCPPLLSSPSGRFKRFRATTLPSLMKPKEEPYINPTVTETPISHLRLNISSSSVANDGISDNYSHILDALLQDSQVDPHCSYTQFVGQCLSSQGINDPQHLYDKILRRKEYNSIKEASLGINLSNEDVPSNGSLLKSNNFSGKSQLMSENYVNKDIEGSGRPMACQLLGCGMGRRTCLKRKSIIDFEDGQCYSRIPNIQSDQTLGEDLAKYSFDFPLSDKTTETLSFDGICESNLFQGHYSAPDLLGYNQNGVLCGSTEILNEHMDIQKPFTRSLDESDKFDNDMKSLSSECSFKENGEIIDVNDEKPSQGSHIGA